MSLSVFEEGEKPTEAPLLPAATANATDEDGDGLRANSTAKKKKKEEEKRCDVIS